MEVIEKSKVMGMFKFFHDNDAVVAAVPMQKIRSCESFDAERVVTAHWEIDGETPRCSNCGVNPEEFFHCDGYSPVCMNHTNSPRRCPNCGAAMVPYGWQKA